MYILTSNPGVWFYRFASDSATPQKVSYGGWPKATALASYTTNLYLLNDDGSIYKYTRNAAGFSPKIVYLSTTNSGGKASALAIDGTVYVAMADGLRQYAGGQAKQTSPIPQELGSITNLRTSSSDTTLTGSSTSTKRVAVWSLGSTSATFTQQIELQNSSQLRDAIYDSATSTFYALVDNRLVRFTNPS